MLEWIVTAEEAGKKLVTFLSERLDGSYSARFLKKSLEMNRCQVNAHTERFASYILAKGDRVCLRMDEAAKESKSVSQVFDSSLVLYEDKSLLIYNKPPKINCDAQGILAILRKRYPAIQLIHRLDQDTTGILLCAKNQIIFDKMVEEFKLFKVKKSYLAIVDGVVNKKTGSIDNYLGKKHVYAGQTIWGPVDKEKGLHAHTDWRLVVRGKQASLLYCLPRTGRTHQIRVHCAGMGHPILGDFQYVKKFTCDFHPPRYLLHAYKIQFKHPLTGHVINIEAPIPQDFLQALRALFGINTISQLDI